MLTFSPWEGDSGYSSLRGPRLIISSPELHLFILLGQLAGFWISTLHFLHDLFEYGIDFLNIVRPDEDTEGLILTQ